MAKKASDEEALAALNISDLLATLLLRAAEEAPRRSFFYCWEQDGLRWLIRYRERGGKGPLNGWTSSFIDLNRDLILSKRNSPIDFNLRAARLRKEAAEG